MDKFQLTTSSAPLAAGFVEALRFHRDVGSKAVEKRAAALAGQLRDALSRIPGVTVVSPAEESMSCGLTPFRIRDLDPGEAVSRLWERHRIVVRQVQELSCIRASTHIFNTEDEIEKLIGAVRGMVD